MDFDTFLEPPPYIDQIMKFAGNTSIHLLSILEACWHKLIMDKYVIYGSGKIITCHQPFCTPELKYVLCTSHAHPGAKYYVTAGRCHKTRKMKLAQA